MVFLKVQIEIGFEITCWAIVSLAGGGLGKVEERQGEKEKNLLTRHLPETSLG